MEILNLLPVHRITIAPRAQTHARPLLRVNHAPIRRPPKTTPKEADDMGHLKTLPPRVLGDQQRLTAKVEPLEDGCGRWRPPNAPAHFTPVCQASSQTPCNYRQPGLRVEGHAGARCQAKGRIGRCAPRSVSEVRLISLLPFRFARFPFSFGL